MFLSNYDSKVDGKNRVSIPAAFRKALGGGDSVFLWPSMNPNKICLEGGPRQLIEDYFESMQDMDSFDDDRAALEYTILGRCKEFAFDGAGGRIVLSKEFKDIAEIESDIKFVGLGNRFEIWSMELYDEMATKMVAHAAKSLRRIGPVGRKKGDVGKA